METIFTYEPTPRELEQITGIDSMNEAEYMDHLKQVAEANKSSVDYERTVDLQELFFVRDDVKKMNEYSHLLDTEFSDISNRLFNE